MGSSSREDIIGFFDALDADLDHLCALSFDALTTPDRLRLLERVERVARRLRVPQHELINQLIAQASEEELGAKLPLALANRLRITRAEADRRIAEAEDLGARRALTGEPLAPRLSKIAAAQREGRIGDGHVKVIRTFFHHLPEGEPVHPRGGRGPPGRSSLVRRPACATQHQLAPLEIIQPGTSCCVDDDIQDSAHAWALSRSSKSAHTWPSALTIIGCGNTEIRISVSAYLRA